MIKLLFFAQFQEQVGEESISIDKSDISIAELKKMITEKYELDLRSVMVAVNEEYAEDNVIVHNGDVVALIPPVSGG